MIAFMINRHWGAQQLNTQLKRVCAWCGQDMGVKDGQGTTGTTHGICPRCARELMNQHKNEKVEVS